MPFLWYSLSATQKQTKEGILFHVYDYTTADSTKT